MHERRWGTVGQIGQGRELVLDLPAPGPWLVFAGAVDPGAVAPDLSIEYFAPGGGAAAVTRPVTPVNGCAVSLPGAGRVRARDPGAVNTPYRFSLAAAPWYPPRWGVEPRQFSLPAGGTLVIAPPPFAAQGRITLLVGSLAVPVLSFGDCLLPPMDILVKAGLLGAEFLVDWEGWL